MSEAHFPQRIRSSSFDLSLQNLDLWFKQRKLFVLHNIQNLAAMDSFLYCSSRFDPMFYAPILNWSVYVYKIVQGNTKPLWSYLFNFEIRSSRQILRKNQEAFKKFWGLKWEKFKKCEPQHKIKTSYKK